MLLQRVVSTPGVVNNIGTKDMLLKKVVYTPPTKLNECPCTSLLYLRRVVNTPTTLGSPTPVRHPSSPRQTQPPSLMHPPAAPCLSECKGLLCMRLVALIFSISFVYRASLLPAFSVFLRFFGFAKVLILGVYLT